MLIPSCSLVFIWSEPLYKTCPWVKGIGVVKNSAPPDSWVYIFTSDEAYKSLHFPPHHWIFKLSDSVSSELVSADFSTVRYPRQQGILWLFFATKSCHSLSIMAHELLLLHGIAVNFAHYLAVSLSLTARKYKCYCDKYRWDGNYKKNTNLTLDIDCKSL